MSGLFDTYKELAYRAIEDAQVGVYGDDFDAYVAPLIEIETALRAELARKDEEIAVLKGVKEHLIQAAARLHKVGVEPDPDYEKEDWWRNVANCGARLARVRLAELHKGDKS